MEKLTVAEMEKPVVAMMVYSAAPLDGTLAPPGAGAGYGSDATGGGGDVTALLDVGAKKWPVEKLAASMAFCEAPFDGTFDGTSAPSSSGAAGGSNNSATGGSNVAAALLDAGAKKWPVERFVASIAFCEAPFDGTFDGTSAPSSSSGAAGGSSGDAAGGSNVVALLDAGAKKLPVERFVASMAFCEAPFDGTFDGTSAPSSSGAATRCSSASANNVSKTGSGEDAAALRRAWLADVSRY